LQLIPPVNLTAMTDMVNDHRRGKHIQFIYDPVISHVVTPGSFCTSQLLIRWDAGILSQVFDGSKNMT